MVYIAIVFASLAAGAVLSLISTPKSFIASFFGVVSAVSASFIALGIAVWSIFTGQSFAGILPGNIPCLFSAFRAIFLIPVALIGFAGALHSVRYIGNSPKHGLTGVYYFAYNLTLLAMMCCIFFTSRISFLLAWEIMGLASFMLVYFDFRTRGVDRASWIYLLSCEAGGLLLMFSFTHAGIAALVCGLLGFGLKAGFPVLHVWLPKAHPVAPAPVSALMSGAMVNLGIFGILTFYDVSAKSCGWTFGILGIIGTLAGIMFSLTKRNIKAILAYSTVENCGIITFGIGCGLIGKAYQLPGLEFFGFLGAFMHLINHASLKGALFLGAGSVYHSSGCLDADKLGGLIRKMPSTGKMFTMASLALAGLPPFNAFISELIIYVALFAGLAGAKSVPIALFCASGIVILGASGAFALASLIRASSGVFFGEPRDSEIFEAAKPESSLMGRAMFITLIPSLIIMLLADKMALFVLRAITPFISLKPEISDAAVTRVTSILSPLCRMNIIITVLAFLLCVAVSRLRRRRQVLSSPTWDCGYVKPTARMQYTSSALVQSITDFFSPLFGIVSRKRGFAISGEQGSDLADRIFWNFIFRVTARWSEKIHRFQTGYLHFYILVMVCALFIMLLWAYFSGGAN